MEKILLSMENIEKTFPGVKALQNVKFNLVKGEVHALMGENGAGKSTLMKILAGLYTKDSGNIIFEGKEIFPKTTLEAQTLGISTVFQELNLIPHATVYENITIGREEKRGIFIDKEANKKKAKFILSDIMGIDIKVDAKLNTLSSAFQQMISIARAILIDCKILILDEPTSSLDKDEVKILFTVIKKLKSQGISIVYISHKMEEIFEISDRITVLRDGKYINTHKTQDINKLSLICEMIGKDASEIVNYKKEYTNNNVNEIVYEIKNLNSITETTNLENLDIKLYKGEVLGLSGLLGSGRTEVTNVMFGLDKKFSGELFINKNKIKKHSPIQAIKNKMALIPEERRKSGIIPNMSVKENLTLPYINKISKFGFINTNLENKIVKEYIEKFQIKVPDMNHKIKNLSGGNQQKVILARWISNDSNLIIMDEPTRGIDIGAKREIEKLIKNMTDSGKSILMISSEMEEMVRNCDRTYVMVDGKVISELIGDEITEKNIIDAMVKFNKREVNI